MLKKYEKNLKITDFLLNTQFFFQLSGGIKFF